MHFSFSRPNFWLYLRGKKNWSLQDLNSGPKVTNSKADQLVALIKVVTGSLWALMMIVTRRHTTSQRVSLRHTTSHDVTRRHTTSHDVTKRLITTHNDTLLIALVSNFFHRTEFRQFSFKKFSRRRKQFFQNNFFPLLDLLVAFYQLTFTI